MKYLTFLLMFACTSVFAQTGIATSSPATLPNGAQAYPSYDLSNNLRVTMAPSSSSGLALVKSSADENSHVLKSSAGNLYTLTTTIEATSGWVLVFDATSAPVDGAVTPAWFFPVSSNGTNGGIAVSWPSVPAKFSTGITVVFSTTGPFTQTKSATAQFSAQVQ